MKLTLFVLLSIFLLRENGCTPKATGNADCIDPSKIDTLGACTMEYNPVCGCDSVTYPNPCVAEKHGVTHYRMGACSGDQ